MKSPMRRLVLVAMVVVFAALALIAGPSSPAIACSSQGPLTEQEFVNQADVIFEGVYVSNSEPSLGNRVASSGDPIFFTFAADRVLKGGPISSQAVVSSSRGAASCGANFTLGVRYRVYARNVAGSLVTDLLSGNRPVPLVSPTTPGPRGTEPSNAAPAVPRTGTPRFTG